MQERTNLTIILTLKDRVPFTHRWMRYMNDMKCPYKILIADGGKDQALEDHLRNPNNYPALNYEYIHYPYDAVIEDYYTKFENVISLVKTQYLLLADNDDFYLLDRIPEILAFLNEHEDYVGARGQLVNLTLFDKTGSSKGLVMGSRYFAVTNHSPSIDYDSPYDRIEFLCKDMSMFDYYANWYCVFRSVSFHQVWQSLIKLPIKEVIVTEILTHVLMVMKGKIKIMSFPFYIRQSNTSMWGDTLVIGNEFLERCLVSNSLSEFGLAIDQFTTVKSKEERDRVLRAIAVWLEVFVANIYFERVKRTKSIMFRVREMIKRNPIFASWSANIYYRSVHLLLPIRKRKLILLNSIEPYILVKKRFK